MVGIIGAASNAFNSSNSAAAVGNLSPVDKKGMVLGCGQSIQAIAHFLSAVIAVVSVYFANNVSLKKKSSQKKVNRYNTANIQKAAEKPK